MQRIQLERVVQSANYTALVLTAPTKSFCIFSEARVGALLQKLSSEVDQPRPPVHKAMASVLGALGWKCCQLQIYNVTNGVFACRLILEQEGTPKQLLSVEIRPSDGIAFALMDAAPIYCSPDVLNAVPAFTDGWTRWGLADEDEDEEFE